MAVAGFAYASERARLARLSVRLSKIPGWVFISLIVALAIWGVLLLVLQIAFGWFVASLFVVPYVLRRINARFLTRLPANSSDTIDGRLESALLGRLPDQLSLKQLISHISAVQSAQFMMIRSGVSPQLLEQLVAGDNGEVALIWSAVRDIQPRGVVKASTVLVACAKVSPQVTNILPHLQLDESDLPRLAGWFDHLDELIQQRSTFKKTGGIARDLSFGYAHLLERFGQNVSDDVARGGGSSVTLEAHSDALDFMVQTFSTSGRQNVALVGPMGSGKTTVVRAFAELLLEARNDLPSSLRYRQIISLSAGALIAAARSRGEIEELMNSLLVEAYHAKNIIICLDDAELFFEESVGSINISSILLPILQNGAIRMILTMDEQRWLQISSKNPALASALNRVTIKGSASDETMLVLQDQLITIEYQRNVTYMYQALKEAIRLSERYLYDQAQPGKAIQVLLGAASYAENGLVTALSVQRSLEKTMGVKVGASVQQDEKDMLLQLEDKIHERMINQTHAVTAVSDALRRARAGVRNEQRPVGTFLFLGPTGTGKTELAKSLAAVYFGGEERLIRLDLNEFVRNEDVSRLIADGADDPMSLSAQVMKQPFSVILLDEIEKAHTSVLTALLQVLDEGILRDIKGREVSFRDAIVIATSNAGADQIRHHLDAGEKIEQFEELLTKELITSGQFRPEFLNRFDEIVLFEPLGKEELFQVIDLIVKGINKTLETQKVTVQLDDGSKQRLVDIGYDPQLGARPLRRAVQRSVESLIAKKLLSGQVQPGETIAITTADIVG
jgi:ATP-dependent Clp protease ATP-binding subunit ClpC